MKNWLIACLLLSAPFSAYAEHGSLANSVNRNRSIPRAEILIAPVIRYECRSIDSTFLPFYKVEVLRSTAWASNVRVLNIEETVDGFPGPLTTSYEKRTRVSHEGQTLVLKGNDKTQLRINPGDGNFFPARLDVSHFGQFVSDIELICQLKE